MEAIHTEKRHRWPCDHLQYINLYTFVVVSWRYTWRLVIWLYSICPFRWWMTFSKGRAAISQRPLCKLLGYKYRERNSPKSDEWIVFLGFLSQTCTKHFHSYDFREVYLAKAPTNKRWLGKRCSVNLDHYFLQRPKHSSEKDLGNFGHCFLLSYFCLRLLPQTVPCCVLISLRLPSL